MGLVCGSHGSGVWVTWYGNFLSSYCLTVDDLAMDARLQRLQQRCLSSERASHCFSSNTPLQERRHRLRTLEENPTLSDAGPTGHESTGSGTRNICSGQKHEGPVTRPVHARLGAKVGAVPPVRRGTKRKLNLRPQVPFDHGMGSTGNGVGSKMATRTDNDIQEGSPLVAGITEVTGQDVDKRSQHMQEEGSANGSEFNYPSTRTENGDMDIRGAEKENTKESRKKVGALEELSNCWMCPDVFTFSAFGENHCSCVEG